MPRGIPKKRQEQANGAVISKMEAMRRALAKLGNNVKPADYQSFIMAEFSIDMDTNMISNYKSTLLNPPAKKSAVIATHKVAATTASGFSLNELEAVKALTDKMGADKVRQLAQALAK